MRYLSQCPNCFTIYHLSLMEISITSGQVRCAQCLHVFDAYSHFIQDPDEQPPPPTNYLTEILSSYIDNDALEETPDTEQTVANDSEPTNDPQTTYVRYVDQYMRQSTEGSRLNLYTYLNYIDTVSPIHSESCESKHTPK